MNSFGYSTTTRRTDGRTDRIDKAILRSVCWRILTRRKKINKKHSAVADKPGDTLCYMQWRGLPHKHALPPYAYHAEFGRSRSNRVGISSGDPAKIGVLHAKARRV